MRDKFYFFSRSSNALPGLGTHESGDPHVYRVLGEMAEWRRVLSNFHVAPFFWRGHTWGSIEHAVQGMKTGMQDAEKALRFTIGSGHVIGQGDGATAHKHRNVVTLTAENNMSWSMKSASVLVDAATAKYAQCAHASAVLEATGDAELWHIMPRGRAHRFGHLEELRTRRRKAALCAPKEPARKAREERAAARDSAREERVDDEEDNDFYVHYH